MSSDKPYVDMWYGDKKEEADKITAAFYDLDNEYRGNIYKNGQVIGDYAVKDSLKLEKLFPQITFDWDGNDYGSDEQDEEFEA